MQLSEAIEKQLEKFDEKLRNVYATVFSLSGFDDKQLKEKEAVMNDFISTAIKEAILDIMPDIVNSLEPPKSWVDCLKVYDKKSNGEYCALCGFNPNTLRNELLNRIKE